MQLSPDQVERFYDIWKPLILFVNRKLKLVPDMLPAKFTGPWDVAKVFKIRDALWADDSLREAFIEQNPANLTAEDLAIVASWQHRQSGGFYILKHLKKHSIFLAEKEPIAYGVLGLTSPLDEVVPFVPCFVKAVLLPFEGIIIYDSLLVPYNVTFGKGIRASLEDTYRDARERGAIITSLPPHEPARREESEEAAHGTDERVLAAFRKHLYRSGLGPKVVERDLAHVKTFAEAYLLHLPEPCSLRDFGTAQLEGFWLHPPAQVAGEKERQKMRVSLRRFFRFLRDTGRMDYATAQEALNRLKG